MNSKRLVRGFVILIILLVNVGCDQISKNIVRQHIDYNETIGLLNNHVTLTKVENSGAFLSLGESLPYLLKKILLIGLPIMALVIGLFYTVVKPGLSKVTLVGLCFVIGGGIGNIFDRIMYGSVTDFLHISLGIFQTGVFNMADVSIMAGVILILAHFYFKRKTLPSATL